MRIRIKASIDHTLKKGQSLDQFKEEVKALFPGKVINLSVKELKQAEED